MDAIEAKVELPDPRYSLDQYSRYYRYEAEKVFANYVVIRDDEAVAGRRQWVNDLANIPLHLDGGCSLLWIVYDPASEEILSIRCNGVA